MVVWSEAVVELLRWRSRRRQMAQAAVVLVAETEHYLASLAGETPDDQLQL